VDDLRKATVLVIGGHSGIGKAISELLENMGVTVYAPSSEILNVLDGMRIIDDALTDQNITHCVYSAGVNELCWIEGIEEPHLGNFENYTDLLNVNVVGFAKVLSALKRNHPVRSVVAISSDAATRPMRGSLMYCSSKAALDMAVRCAARELAPKIRVNAVSPGMTDGTLMQEYIDKTVPVFRGWTVEEARSYEESQNPMGRRATTEEIAHVTIDVLFGPEYMTGSIVTVNGGR
jgi:NAD(P)-dependent dehydrogenase (short-subunit alcohol dehydrogenase family)